MTKAKLSEEQQRLYKSEMKKIKDRVSKVTLLLSSPLPPDLFTCQSAALQLRMVLEGIAMSTLVIHEDEYKEIYSGIENKWKAVGSPEHEGILNEVKKINPDCYPKPVKDIVRPNGEREIVLIEEMEGFQLDYLKEENFLSAYNKLGSWLHAENAFSKPRNLSEMYDYELSLLNKIIALLNSHIVGFSGIDILYTTQMKTNISDDVQVNEFKFINNI